MNDTILRHSPVQTRSEATLTRIRRAASAALAEHGRDRFTTAHVADLAGVSIGTVYRYYPDRVAILADLFPDAIEGLDGGLTHYVLGVDAALNAVREVLAHRNATLSILDEIRAALLTPTAADEVAA